MAREPILMACCGKKGVGKSFATMIYLREYVRHDPYNPDPSKVKTGRKVLIFDVNNEYSDKSKFPDIRAIYLKDIPAFSLQQKPEIRRVAPFYDDGTPMSLDNMSEVLQWLVQNFKNGLLLIEDINKYVSDTMPGDLIGAICTNRHTGVDIILHYQSIGRLAPKVWQNINAIRLHKNQDSVGRHYNKFPDKYEMLQIAEKIIEKQFRKKNIRFYLFVSFDEDIIYAEDVPLQEIKEAISEFVAENFNELISPMLRMRGREGRMYDDASAISTKESQLLEQYFDIASTEE